MKVSDEFIKKIYQFGVVDFGYTEELNAKSFNKFSSWIDNQSHQPLNYLSDERKIKRESLSQFWEPCSSAMVFLFSYKNIHNYLNHLYKNDSEWNGLKIASFTMGFNGNDYHIEIKNILYSIGNELKKEYPDIEFKICLDTHPVLERDLAYRAGLGWFGKNSMFISRQEGSFTLIASLLLNKKLEFNHGTFESDHCGQCTRCIDSCPTQAIDPNSRTIIAKDCISTFTIEEFKSDSIPSPKMNLTSGFIFGCDICQDVCPWNKRLDRISAYTNVPQLTNEQTKIINFFLKRKTQILLDDLTTFSEGQFKKLFSNTSFERSGKRGVLKNIKLYLKQLNIFS